MTETKPRKRPFPLAPGTLVSVYPPATTQTQEEYGELYDQWCHTCFTEEDRPYQYWDYQGVNLDQVQTAGWLYLISFVGTVDPNAENPTYSYHDPEGGHRCMLPRGRRVVLLLQVHSNGRRARRLVRHGAARGRGHRSKGD